jgi:CRP/FNR family transcriptional regulator
VAVAVATTFTYRISATRLTAVTGSDPTLRRQRFAWLAAELNRATLLSANCSVEERVATFLIGIAQRQACHGSSTFQFELLMSRSELANYTCTWPRKRPGEHCGA